MTFTIFASGSTGNCALVSAGDTHILVDAGISARRIGDSLARWGLSPADLTAVVVTHAHRDHIAGLPTLTRRFGFPLYAAAPTARQLCYQMALEGRVHTFDPGGDFPLGALSVHSIPTSHDAPGSVGYRFTSPQGRAAVVVTDLGVVTPQVEAGVRGADLAVIECNHDLDCLRTGPYPYPLQARVAGPQGHLSNEDGAALCALAARSAHTIVLAHLSQQNNSPSLALRAVRRALADCPPVRLEVAPVRSEGLRWEV